MISRALGGNLKNIEIFCFKFNDNYVFISGVPMPACNGGDCDGGCKVDTERNRSIPLSLLPNPLKLNFVSRRLSHSFNFKLLIFHSYSD